MEKLSIQNFAGIKSMDFEFKAINILIGPQGSGKSVIVKLHYYFGDFFHDFRSGELVELSKKEIDDRLKERFVLFFPKDAWPLDDFSISYIFNDTEVSVSKVNKQLKINFSDNLKKAISRIGKKFLSGIKGKRGNQFSQGKSMMTMLGELITEEIGTIIPYEQIFIPAGRSFFANIQGNIFSLLSNKKSLDPFLIEFGAVYETIRHLYTDPLIVWSKEKAFSKIVAEILNGNYLREKDEDYLVHTDKRKVRLTNASSGQQETLPLIIILEALSQEDFGYKSTKVYIEEPEAHLFPNAQKAVVQLFARVFNMDKNRQIFVTTHSPYILSSFNNLLEAGRLRKMMPDRSKDIAKVIPVAEQLEPGLLAAYSINDGKKEDLIDAETSLIKQTVLDSISNDIAIEFGKLLDIEF